GDEFLEARIIPERIENWVEPGQRRSERPRSPACIRYRQKFLQSGGGAVGLSHLRRHPGEYLERPRTSQGVFLDRIRGHGPFRQSQRGGFVTKARIGQREISNEVIIFRLFFEERFQFGARLSPTFLRTSMIAGDFLRPAQPNAQLTIEITQRWIRLGQYFLQPRNDLDRPTLQDRLVNLCF